MKRLSIKARVTFWYTLLVALIALLAAGALFWSAQRMMDNYYEEALVGTTQLALNDVRMEDGERIATLRPTCFIAEAGAAAPITLGGQALLADLGMD